MSETPWLAPKPYWCAFAHHLHPSVASEFQTAAAAAAAVQLVESEVLRRDSTAVLAMAGLGELLKLAHFEKP